MVEKAEKLNSDAYESDLTLINDIQQKLNLPSKKDVLHVLCDGYRGTKSEALERGKLNCEFRSPNGSYCSCNDPKLEKTNEERCSACQKAKAHRQRIFEQEDYLERIWHQKIGIPFGLGWTDPVARLNFVLKKFTQNDKEIEDLRRPNEALLAEKSNLQTEFQNMKNALVARIEEIAVLETDNARLREEMEELQHDPLLEKNAALTVQLGRNEQVIIDLKSEVEKQEALINAQKLTISDVTTRTSKMLQEFQQYKPLTLEPYDISNYLTGLLKRIADFEGYLNTVTVQVSNRSKVF